MRSLSIWNCAGVFAQGLRLLGTGSFDKNGPEALKRFPTMTAGYFERMGKNDVLCFRAF